MPTFWAPGLATGFGERIVDEVEAAPVMVPSPSSGHVHRAALMSFLVWKRPKGNSGAELGYCTSPTWASCPSLQRVHNLVDELLHPNSKFSGRTLLDPSIRKTRSVALTAPPLLQAREWAGVSKDTIIHPSQWLGTHHTQQLFRRSSHLGLKLLWEA